MPRKSKKKEQDIIKNWMDNRLIPIRILEKYQKQGVAFRILSELIDEITPYIRLGKNNVTKTNPIVEINGEKRTLKEWSVQSGISYLTLMKRYKRGLTGDKLLQPQRTKQGKSKFDPHIVSKKLKVNGVEKSIGEWAEEVEIHPHLIFKRLQRGWKPYEAIIPKNVTKDQLYRFQPISIYGETKTLEEWANEYGLKPKTIFKRIKDGWKANELIFPADVTNQNKEIFIKEEFYRYRYLIINGVSKTYGEWSEEFGIPIHTLIRRKELKWSDDSLLLPTNKEMTVKLDGEEKSLKELSKMSGLTVETIRNRIRNGKKGWELVFPKPTTYMTIGNETYLFKTWMKKLNLSAKEMYELYQKYKKGLDKKTINWVLKELNKTKKDKAG